MKGVGIQSPGNGGRALGQVRDGHVLGDHVQDQGQEGDQRGHGHDPDLNQRDLNQGQDPDPGQKGGCIHCQEVFSKDNFC